MDLGQVPVLIDSDISRKVFRKNWARLIQKVYNVDPLVCPKSLGSMKIISLIDDLDVIKKILKHLGLWLSKRPPLLRAHALPEPVRIDYLDYQIPSVHDYLIDPNYPIDSWLN